MSEDIVSSVITKLPEYRTAIEGLRPFKRTMLLWSTVSLLYVFFGLHLGVSETLGETSGKASLWGFQIDGLTDTKLTIFFLLATLYYTIRWRWTWHLRIRTFKNDGFIKRLRQFGMPLGKEKPGGRHAYKEMKRTKDERGVAVLHQELRVALSAVEGDRANRGAIDDLFGETFLAKIVSFIEHIVIPHHLPLAIALLALTVLAGRLCL